MTPDVAETPATGTRVVHVGPVAVGAGDFTLIAGPCAVESQRQLETVARYVSDHGAAILRGGLFKLRTDPSSFQGLGEAGVELLRGARELTGLPSVTEVTDPRQIAILHDHIDMFQVGTRNMYNYALLKELGQTRKPVLLKRAMSALIDEWLLAAEYIIAGGNQDVILCERGIRTFETKTRNTLDLSAVAWLKQNCDLPVIVDPSHGTGRSELVEPLTLAAAALGADGAIIEVHPEPTHAFSDGRQALDLPQFGELAEKVRALVEAIGRRLSSHVAG